jgi:hypothetical protein
MALALASVVGVGASALAQYPPRMVLVLNPTTVAPRAEFTATLTGCTPGEVVTFSLVSGSATATCTGSATVTLTAPSTVGTFTVTASAPSGTASATLRVVAQAAAAEELPRSGSDSLPIVRIGAGLLIAGLGLIGVVWYRRRSSAAA